MPGHPEAARLDGHTGPHRDQRARRLSLLLGVRGQTSERPGAISRRSVQRGYRQAMIDAIITSSIRHRGIVIAAGLVLGILGAWAAWVTPVDAIPDLSENQVIVFAEWKGHGPREIEEQATYPLALGLQGLRGVRVVRSSSEVGF